MPGGIVNDPVSRMLQFALTGLSRRQEIVAENVANVDTPRFKASSVPFETQLKAALKGRPDAMLVTHPQHIQREGMSLGEPMTVTDRSPGSRNDGNNVDIEREMFQLAETTLRHQTVARSVTERLGWLRMVLSEGRR